MIEKFIFAVIDNKRIAKWLTVVGVISLSYSLGKIAALFSI